MTKPLPHAEIIKHMVEHGFDSVEGQILGDWYPATDMVNPLTRPELPWRIKPVTVTVEIPRPIDAVMCTGTTFVLGFSAPADATAALAAIKKAMES